jgi:polyhydroxyalkanoate synthesis regulator phasin
MLKDRIGDYVTRICDVCGHEQVINYWNAYKKDRHLCRYCNNNEQGKNRIGKFEAYNKGFKNKPKDLGNFYINSGGYVEVWVGKHTLPGRAGGYYREHRLMVEKDIGRLLTTKEVIHHIDGDKVNNKLSNLFLCSDDKHHQNVHSQLERVATTLVKEGVIRFSKQSGEYYIDPYIRDIISKSLELLENPEKDNQQRSIRELCPDERSTTIQEWSTLKRVEAGDIQEDCINLMDDDIVCSA